MFEAPKLTNAGKALYYRNLGGEALRITTMQLGDGQLSNPIATLTGLVHSVVSIDAAVKQRTDYVEVNAKFSNAGLSAGFYWRELASSAQTRTIRMTAARIFFTAIRTHTTLQTISPPQQRNWWKKA
jgi:hypothetical protein